MGKKFVYAYLFNTVFLFACVSRSLRPQVRFNRQNFCLYMLFFSLIVFFYYYFALQIFCVATLKHTRQKQWKEKWKKKNRKRFLAAEKLLKRLRFNQADEFRRLLLQPTSLFRACARVPSGGATSVCACVNRLAVRPRKLAGVLLASLRGYPLGAAVGSSFVQRCLDFGDRKQRISSWDFYALRRTSSSSSFPSSRS